MVLVEFHWFQVSPGGRIWSYDWTRGERSLIVLTCGHEWPILSADGTNWPAAFAPPDMAAAEV